MFLLPAGFSTRHPRRVHGRSFLFRFALSHPTAFSLSVFVGSISCRVIAMLPIKREDGEYDGRLQAPRLLPAGRVKENLKEGTVAGCFGGTPGTISSALLHRLPSPPTIQGRNTKNSSCDAVYCGGTSTCCHLFRATSKDAEEPGRAPGAPPV